MRNKINRYDEAICSVSEMQNVLERCCLYSNVYSMDIMSRNPF